MAVEKVIEIVARTEQAAKDIKDLFNDMVKQEKEALKQTEKLNESVDDIGKTSKDTQKGVQSITNGFKSMGLALKGLGIGLILSALSTLKDLLFKNQRVVDTFNTAFEALSIAFSDFFDFVIDNSGTVIDFFKGIFNDPLESIKSFGRLIKDNIIERFNSALEVAGFLGDALKKLFSGDFEGAWESAKEAGKEMVDVLTGVDGTVDKVADGFNTLIEKGSEYAKNVYEQAKANVELKNTAQLAAAEQARLVEIYDRQAEKLRQLRDDDTKSVADRIKYNEMLNDVLDKQEKAMISAADAQVAAAQATLATNNTIENQVALTDALANKEGVLAQIEGFRSEQLANRNSLLREQIELNNSISDAEKERRLEQLDFEASQEESELAKLDKMRERFELENEIIEEDIERKRELYAEGTQARVDAENEYLAAKQEINNALIANEQATSDETARIKQEEEDKKKFFSEQTEAAKIQLAGQTLNIIGELAGKGSAVAKGVAVAQTTIETYKSATSAYSAMSGIPIVGPALGAVAAGLAVASGLINVKKILSTKPIETKAPSASGGSVPSPPSFNLVQGTGANQIAEGINSQQQPVEAYVVSGNVTSQQALDRNASDTASI